MMDDTTVYKRSRSVFYLRINENSDGSYAFFVSEPIIPVFSYHFSDLVYISPRGWESAKGNIQYIWIPENLADEIDVDDIKDWADIAYNCVWLTASQHIEPFFQGTEIEHCIAADFNFVPERTGEIQKRILLGDAEWQLKYHFHELNDEQKATISR